MFGSKSKTQQTPKSQRLPRAKSTGPSYESCSWGKPPRPHFRAALTSSSLHPIQESDFELCVRPQSTYTTFLPTVYQEVDYIHRFIEIFEQAFDPVVNSFTSMWAHLDPLTAPQALLPFLAHWVDWPIDEELDLTYQRRLIRRAVEIYRCRGTRKGLRFQLHL